MLAPLLAFIVCTIHTIMSIYVQFIRNNCITMLNNFVHICQFHLTTDRANKLYNSLEMESLNKEIIKSSGEYKDSIMECNDWRDDKDVDNMKRLFKIADELNYITIQTSAHNVEFVVVFLIIQRTKLRNITKYFNKKNSENLKKINQILFVVCLTEKNIYATTLSFLTTLLILKIFYSQRV